jgi:exopolysaccharide biosynthesis polyprenyl glycosylphosphotransferase
MGSGLRYRAISAAGTATLVTVAVLVANHPLVQRVTHYVPIYALLPETTLTNDELSIALATAVVVVLAALLPLFRPQPRRVLDVLGLLTRRVLGATVALAAIGYFDYTYRLPRATLVVTAGLLLATLPPFFLAIRRRPSTDDERVVLVGDDPDAMAEIHDATDFPVLGYVSSPSTLTDDADRIADGGVTAGRAPVADLDCLGGLSRLDEVLVEHDVETVALAFSRPDRAEFFGSLATCYDHGVTAKIHGKHANSVLTRDVSEAEVVDIDLEPWDPQDYVLKRLFDVAFAATGLVVLSPVMLVVAAAIRLDSPGPVLYSQQRTAEFGDTFTVYKFRSMVPEAESETGATISSEDDGEVDPRVTRVGRVLRRTHLDEIPQLWTVLVGDMSVVGPRPERPELDADIERGVGGWPARWFVKPGLTGLAQVNGVTGSEPERKLRYDVEYIRQQSFRVDLELVGRQFWTVAVDVGELVRDRLGRSRASG